MITDAVISDYLCSSSVIIAILREYPPANPQHVRAFFQRDSVIIGHAHGQIFHLNTRPAFEFFGDLVAQKS